MPRLRDVLARFRPAGAPGAAVAGVPGDRAAELAAELRPTLDGLEEAQEAARRMRAAADQEAAAVTRTAAERARAIVERARAEAPHVRRAAEREARQDMAGAVARVISDGDAETRELRAAIAERMPAMVELLAERALSGRRTRR